MKCDKCENEAMLHYESTVNGEKTEYHLCEDCARSEGFGAPCSTASCATPSSPAP